jgi:hypothetical protein
MEALRIFAKPVNGQLVIDLPPSLKSVREAARMRYRVSVPEANRTYEAIVLSAISEESVATPRRRQPSAKLAGTVRLLDDLIAPATPESDWELS